MKRQVLESSIIRKSCLRSSRRFRKFVTAVRIVRSEVETENSVRLNLEFLTIISKTGMGSIF